MNLRTLFWLYVMTGCLMAPIAQGQSFSFDGYKTSDDSYDNQRAVYFFNGHKNDESTYGTQSDPIYQTYIHWGTGTDANDNTNTQYFFLYVETPIEVKNMLWGSAFTQADTNEYGKSLDYGGATGSEHIKFMNASSTDDGGDGKKDKKSKDEDGNVIIYTGLGKSDKNVTTTGQLNVKSSLDYLLANGATEADSNAGSVNSREIGMAFEYKFELNATANEELLDSIVLIEYHLSPERGLIPTQVPEPTAPILVGISAVIGILRRKR
jgi:hypothetical protein